MLLTPLVLSACLLPLASAVVTPPTYLTTRATPPCNITAISPPPSGAVCNKQGVLKKPPATPLSGPSSSTQTGCRDSCVTNSACSSFGFNTVSKQCTLYSKALSSYGFTASTSNTVFSAKGCYKQTCLQCNSPETYCSGQTCSNLNTDLANCGSCGNACSGGKICTRGTCRCPSGTTLCKASNTCVDTTSDKNNCGSCGNICPAKSTCSNGSCVCNGSLTLCSGACLNLNTNIANCGTCGNACTGSQICSNGTCKCPSGVLNDSNNCGSCGTKCGTGQTCLNGQCACASGTLGDNNNCGSCGTACNNGESCQSGQCVCPDGTSPDFQSDVNNCGSCANACLTNQMFAVDEVCSNGQCVCPSGTLGDNDNCGGCGIGCPYYQSCFSGTCGCPSGQISCHVGGCVDPQVDAYNCGACDNQCPAGSTCSNGSCIGQTAYLYGITPTRTLPVTFQVDGPSLYLLAAPGTGGYFGPYEKYPYTLDPGTGAVNFITDQGQATFSMTTWFGPRWPTMVDLGNQDSSTPLQCQLVPYTNGDQQLQCNVTYNGVLLDQFYGQPSYIEGLYISNGGPGDPDAEPVTIISSSRLFS